MEDWEKELKRQDSVLRMSDEERQTRLVCTLWALRKDIENFQDQIISQTRLGNFLLGILAMVILIEHWTK